MSAAYKCDRCGRLKEGHPVFLSLQPYNPAGDHVSPWAFQGSLSLDICPECEEAVRNFFRKVDCNVTRP